MVGMAQRVPLPVSQTVEGLDTAREYCQRALAVPGYILTIGQHTKHEAVIS